jgi:hypothetical protein
VPGAFDGRRRRLIQGGGEASGTAERSKSRDQTKEAGEAGGGLSGSFDDERPRDLNPLQARRSRVCA